MANGNINLNDHLLITHDGSGVLLLDRVIQDNNNDGRSVTKSGTGILTLTQANTFSGGFTLNEGVVRVGNGGALGDTGTITLNGGVLTSDTTTARTLARPVVVGGSVTLGDATNNGAITFSGGMDLGGASRQLTLASNVTVSGAVTNGSLVKSGTGTLTLSGSNSYTGGTTINQGALNLGSADAIGSEGEISFAGGRLQYSAANTTDYSSRFSSGANQGYAVDTNNQTVTLASILSSSGGSLTKSGSGTLKVTGLNTYDGITTIGGGILEVSSIGNFNNATGSNLGRASAAGLNNTAAGSSGGDSTNSLQLIGNGATLRYVGAGETSNRAIYLESGIGNNVSIDASGSGPLVLSGPFTNYLNNSSAGNSFFNLTGSSAADNALEGTFTDALRGASQVANLRKQGSGTWSLINSRGYRGITIVEEGVLKFDSIANAGTASALGTAARTYVGLALVDYHVSLGTGTTAGTLLYTGAGNSSSNRVVSLGGNGTLDAGAASGVGSLTFTGSVSSRASSGSQTLTLRGANPGANTISGVISDGTAGGALALVKADAGRWVLSGANTYSGGTQIDGGTLLAGHASAFGTGAIVLASGATLNLNGVSIANTITNNGGTILSALNYTGTANLVSGSSSLTNVGGFVDIDATAVADLSGTIDAEVVVKGGGRARAFGQLRKNVSVGGGGHFDILNDASIDEAASFGFANDGQIHIDRTSNLALAKAISGTGTLRKSGSSRVRLTGINTFTGATQIDAGALIVNGALAGDVVVGQNAVLGGSGVLGDTLSGAGLISVGNSPGIGTAGSVDPSLGTDWVFEITGTAPIWSSGTAASTNDVLRLTDATPFLNNLTSGNVVDVLFDLGTPALAAGSYLGGFFVDNASFDLAAALTAGEFRYWVRGEHGEPAQQQQFGVGADGALLTYSLLTAFDPALTATYRVTPQTANFGAGNVSGQVTEFVVVPEPGTLVGLGFGIVLAGWRLGKRRR